MITPGIFKANDIRGATEGPASAWDAEGAYAIGAVLVDVLDLTHAERALVVGRDMRLSSPQMSAAFVSGVLSRGVDVIDIGLASTDELWFASGCLGLPGAMFTASHNPGTDNGIKFCLAGAKPIAPEQLKAIADRVLGEQPSQAASDVAAGS
jgi:phosphomannomutase